MWATSWTHAGSLEVFGAFKLRLLKFLGRCKAFDRLGGSDSSESEIDEIDRLMSFFLNFECRFRGGSNWHLEFDIAPFSASRSHFRDRKAHSADMVLVYRFPLYR